MQIQTYTGRLVDLERMRPIDVDLVDLAHALGNLCRFTGHTKDFYSVATHSTHVVRGLASETVEPELVGSLAPVEAELFRKALLLKGLLHDAHEAYLGDIARPIKPRFKNLREITDQLDRVIWSRLGFPIPAEWETTIAELVLRADDRMLATEKRDVLAHPDVPWPGDVAEPFKFTVVAEEPQASGATFQTAFNLIVRETTNVRSNVLWLFDEEVEK